MDLDGIGPHLVDKFEAYFVKFMAENGPGWAEAAAAAGALRWDGLARPADSSWADAPLPAGRVLRAETLWLAHAGAPKTSSGGAGSAGAGAGPARAASAGPAGRPPVQARAPAPAPAFQPVAGMGAMLDLLGMDPTLALAPAGTAQRRGRPPSAAKKAAAAAPRGSKGKAPAASSSPDVPSSQEAGGGSGGGGGDGSESSPTTGSHRPYHPKPRTGGHALLLALLEAEGRPQHQGFCTKEDLIREVRRLHQREQSR